MAISMTEPSYRLLLAHGAGAGAESPFMQQMKGLYAAVGIDAVLFNFPYWLKALQQQRRRPPDRMPVLLDSFREQFAAIPRDLPIFIGGKSMGGRVATLLMDELQTPAVVLGYPFHPLGKPGTLRIGHLQTLTQPLLIIQGARDAFGTQNEINGYSLPSSTLSMAFLEDGDHSLKPRKSSGFTLLDHQQRAVTLTLEFFKRCNA